MTKSMLFELNVWHMQRCYCEVATNVVYELPMYRCLWMQKSHSMIIIYRRYTGLWELQCSREYKMFHKHLSTFQMFIHATKEMIYSHNISLLGMQHFWYNWRKVNAWSVFFLGRWLTVALQINSGLWHSQNLSILEVIRIRSCTTSPGGWKSSPCMLLQQLPDRTHLVHAKLSTIIHIKVSYLPQQNIMQHSQAGGQAWMSQVTAFRVTELVHLLF